MQLVERGSNSQANAMRTSLHSDRKYLDKMDLDRNRRWEAVTAPWVAAAARTLKISRLIKHKLINIFSFLLLG